MAEKALAAVIQEACTPGTRLGPTRSVDDLVQAMGMSVRLQRVQAAPPVLCGEIDD